jgi:hypothetical protein
MNVNVLGTEYELILKTLPRGVYGYCNPDKKTIKIDPNKGEFGETLVHEVLHAALWESGIIHVLQTDGLEEAIVRALEHGLKTANLMPEVTIYDYDENTVSDEVEEHPQG